jgi:dsRNA-specific ribonuclease
MLTSNLREVASLEESIGHVFASPEFLQRALTHSSQAREAEMLRPGSGERAPDNEQLEFLGDAVLGLVTTEELFRRFPGFNEGQLSKLRAHLVSKNHLIRVAEQLQLGKFCAWDAAKKKAEAEINLRCWSMLSKPCWARSILTLAWNQSGS